MNYSSNKIFTGSTLKIIAIISMLIDHIAAFIVTENNITAYYTMREIGRFAFPIFCFLLVEGYFHTRDIKKYLLRLLLFAFVSEVPFDLVRAGTPGLSFDHQNVFFTLALGLLLIYIIDNNQNKKIMQCVAIMTVCFIALLLRVDYSFYGIIQIMIFYFFRYMRFYRIAGVIIVNLALIQPAGAMALVFTELYNGKKGVGLKYVFYAFYPVHLLIIYLLNMFISQI